MTGFKLKNKFRTAVLAGLAAIGGLTGCRSPDTQIIPDKTSFINVDQGKFSDWQDRQYSYLTNDSNRVHYQAWLSKLDDAKNHSLLDKANEVNDLVNNSVTWVDDSITYHQSEYWASGVETILQGVGDCEDFAIAKLYALDYLNVPENRMYILSVASDTTVSKESNHAVLAVDTSAANDWTNCLILNDNEGSKNTLETLGQNGYDPHVMINMYEIRLCKAKVVKPPKLSR
jgi:hypothetical protein